MPIAVAVHTRGYWLDNLNDTADGNGSNLAP